MSKENNEDIEKMSYPELVGYHFEVRNKLRDGSLTKEERAVLMEKKTVLDQKLKERNREFREIVKKGNSLEEIQHRIENMEFVVKRSKGLSPREIEKIKIIINDQKRRLEKIKSRKED